MSKTHIIAGLALAAVAALTQACTVPASPRVEAAHVDAPKPQPSMSVEEQRGLAFAKLRCSACHAVIENGTSPNPESPPFADIANRPGVTTATMRQFLSDSHNYPDAMNFRVDDTQIMDLAEYILTMKKANYQPQM